MRFDLDSYYIDPIKHEDAWNLCNFVVSNEDRLRRFFPKTLQQNQTPDLAKIFVDKKTRQFNLKEEFLFTIKEKKSHILVGLVYIKELDWTKKQGEFAYCIGYSYESQGITTRSVKVLSEFAFKDLALEALQIIVFKANIASIKVAENCNFLWKKTLKNAFTPPGEKVIDMELYELYNEIE